MDPIIAGIVVVLGKYALDKAVEIAPVVGEVATHAISNLFDYVTRKLSAKGEREAVIVTGFINDPDTYKKPFEKELQIEIESNPVFAQSVRDLVNEYNNAIQSQNLDSSYRINVKGDFRATGSVFGSGQVSSGGDIVGGSKIGS